MRINCHVNSCETTNTKHYLKQVWSIVSSRQNFPIYDAKLSQQMFGPCYEKGLIKIIPNKYHYLYVSLLSQLPFEVA